MTDPFDVFDPFAPLGAENEPEPQTGEKKLEHSTDEPEPRGSRRWSAVLASPTPAPAFPTARLRRQEPGAEPAVPGSLRSIVLSELRGLVARLLEHGHEASIEDDLAAQHPLLVVNFRPDAGPLGSLAAGKRNVARFELRFVVGRIGGTEAVAGYKPGTVGAPFTLLGRTPASAVDGRWISQRLVEFVERTLLSD